ncbi:MAG: HNH endonuclease [Spirochaetes bacterium]|nr:HNH endonuclease [Spirochaetota bacterium]
MGKKDEPGWKQERKRNRQLKESVSGFSDSTGSTFAVEKQKARDLRNSSWWKKKISEGKCYYCGKNFHPSELTMDHKIPLARGGKSERINLVAACKECNNKKKYLLPVEWEEYLENIKKSD